MKEWTHGDWGRLCDCEGGRDDGDDGEDVAEGGLHVFRQGDVERVREREGRVGRARQRNGEWTTGRTRDGPRGEGGLKYRWEAGVGLGAASELDSHSQNPIRDACARCHSQMQPPRPEAPGGYSDRWRMLSQRRAPPDEPNRDVIQGPRAWELAANSTKQHREHCSAAGRGPHLSKSGMDLADTARSLGLGLRLRGNIRCTAPTCPIPGARREIPRIRKRARASRHDHGCRLRRAVAGRCRFVVEQSQSSRPTPWAVPCSRG